MRVPLLLPRIVSLDKNMALSEGPQDQGYLENDSVLRFACTGAIPAVTALILIQRLFEVFAGEIGPQDIHKDIFGIG